MNNNSNNNNNNTNSNNNSNSNSNSDANRGQSPSLGGGILQALKRENSVEISGQRVGSNPIPVNVNKASHNEMNFPMSFGNQSNQPSKFPGNFQYGTSAPITISNQNNKGNFNAKNSNNTGSANNSSVGSFLSSPGGSDSFKIPDVKKKKKISRKLKFFFFFLPRIRQPEPCEPWQSLN
jgi:hypothetical protein